MLASRTALRATRRVRVQSLVRTARRLESTARTPPPPPRPSDTTSDAVVGGLVGGGLVALLGYGYYRYSGLATVVNTTKTTKAKVEEAIKKSTEKVPEPNEAIQWLRQTAVSYARFIPGAKGYVNSAFDDIEAMQRKHGEEVDRIVKDAYDQLKDISKESVSMDTVTKVWDVIQTAVRRIGDLASDGLEDILNNHPELKNKLGGNIYQLKNMGDELGPEAKKIADDTWNQVQDILKGGIGLGTADQLRRLIQDKTQEVRQLADKAWQKGMEQAKPYLDKSPKAKELLLQNKDKLMQSNLTELWEKVRDAAMSGNTNELENFINQTRQRGKSNDSWGLGQYLNMIPGGSEIIPKFQQLQEITEKHGEEAEKLVKDTFKEIGEVLRKKEEEAKRLAEKTK